MSATDKKFPRWFVSESGIVRKFNGSGCGENLNHDAFDISTTSVFAFEDLHLFNWRELTEAEALALIKE